MIHELSDYSIVLGGSSNRVHGAHSTAAGRRAVALHDGTFVWGDSTDDEVQSSGADEFTVRASGGTRFFSSSDLSTGVTLPSGGGSWSSLSDRNAKADFASVEPEAILAKVVALPLSTWRYKAQDSSIRHIGPMAQDFHAAFGVGEDERRISSIDMDGVALAAIQGLNQKLDAKESEVHVLRVKNRDLETRLAALERLVAQIVER